VSALTLKAYALVQSFMLVQIKKSGKITQINYGVIQLNLKKGEIVMSIENLLRYAGLVLIALGLIAGTFGWSTVDFDSYKIAKEVYDDISDNEIAEASYNSAKTIFLSEISLVLGSAIGSIIGGLVLMGLGRLIDNQSDILKALNTNK
jgi:hypothetical protein